MNMIISSLEILNDLMKTSNMIMKICLSDLNTKIAIIPTQVITLMVQSINKGNSLKIELDVTFKEALLGSQKRFIAQKYTKCEACDGTRAQKGTEIEPWYSCNSTGIKKDHLFGRESKCNTCQGHGKIPKTPCKTCNGTGLTESEHKMAINIPPMTLDNDYLTVQSQGHESSFVDGEPGDLI